MSVRLCRACGACSGTLGRSLDQDDCQGPLDAGPAEVAISPDRPLVPLLVVDQSFPMVS